MNYTVTCLTPTLVGDGQKLAPIDYMVWKDQVNVLDQRRIFKLLARGPRLDGYLAQLKRAQKLDFASWGGFAQSFAGRRIPFADASSVQVWEKTPAELLFIPTFASNNNGVYIPGTAVKGALRSGAVFERWTEDTLRQLDSKLEDRLPRWATVKAEEAAIGSGKASRVSRFAIADSQPAGYESMKVYLLRVSTLVSRGGKLELGWKAGRGSVEDRRAVDSIPAFAEMAGGGSRFQGTWSERSEIRRGELFQAANHHAQAQLEQHLNYATQYGLEPLAGNIRNLLAKIDQVKSSGGSTCVINIGWGAGLLGKTAFSDTTKESYRNLVRRAPVYQRAIQSGLPFPKTRRIIFEGDRPASLPGWVLLEVQ